MMRSPLALAGGLLLLLAGCLPAVAFVPSGRSLGAPSHSHAPTSLAAVREATFGMGCFWEPAESLLKEPGVLGTTVGYTGAPPSKKKAPTYDAVCFGNDWVEGVRVAYDDEVVSYSEVLDYFFEAQKPANSRQYASIVFASDASQEKEAEKWKRDNAGITRDDGLPYDIVEIEPSSAFYRAEEYHQRYWEKQRLRFLVGFLLIAGESGAYNNLFDGALANVDLFGLSFDGLCGAVFLAGAAWTILERLVAGDVRELEEGELAASLASEAS